MEPDELEILSTHYQLNNSDPNEPKPVSAALWEQTKSLALTSTEEMEPELPQIGLFYRLNNAQVVTTSETSQAVELPQFKSVCSEYPAANCNDVGVLEVDSILNNEQTTATSETLTQVMETKLPEIKMVYSEYNEVSDGDFEKFEDIAISSTKQYEFSSQIMDNELLKIGTVYPECKLSSNTAFSDFKIGKNSQINLHEDTAQSESATTDQPQIQMVYNDQSLFCKLETVLSPNNQAILTQIINNVQSENKVACSEYGKLQSCETNNNSSLTQAVDVELPQITEVSSELSASSDKLAVLMSTVSKTQTEMEISKFGSVDHFCDRINTAPIQEAATSNNKSSNEIDASLEECKKISVKKEIIDEDEEFVLDDDDDDDDDDSITSESCLNLNKYIKSEFRIKSEEVDVKDEDKISERHFECRKCNMHFYLECTYRLHVLSHDNTKPHQCDACPFKCNKKKKMLAHLRNHTGEKKIPCKICKEYYYFFNVVEHFQKCPKPPRYHCEECEYGTNQKFYYERHLRLHTGERLKCSRCDLSFLDNVARKKHYKCHTKEKPYQCHICYRRFKLRGARERHILAYCDRRCPKCDYISIYCTDFYEHVRAVHPFTKLKLQLQKYYRQYDRVLAKNSNHVISYEIETEFDNYEMGQSIETNPLTEVDYKCEASQNIEYNKEQNVGCEMEQINSKENRNSDYELIQNIKYELIESTENYGYNTNYDSINLGADYDYQLMQNVKFDLAECAGYVKQNVDCRVEENTDYDLIQNVNCELTEGTEDYTLLCL